MLPALSVPAPTVSASATLAFGVMRCTVPDTVSALLPRVSDEPVEAAANVSEATVALATSNVTAWPSLMVTSLVLSGAHAGDQIAVLLQFPLAVVERVVTLVAVAVKVVVIAVAVTVAT